MSCSVSAPTDTPNATNQPPLDIPAVTINGATITPEAISKEIQYHPAASAEQARDAAIKALLIQQAMLQRAKELKLDEGLQYKEPETEDEAMVRVLIEKEVQTPKASQEDCLRYFEANRDKFNSGNLVEAKHILIGGNPEDPVERDIAKQKAQKLIGTLMAEPERFAELAQAESACPSKEVGGSLGQISKGQTTPEFERQVLSLEPGLANYPIETRYGYHVVYVERKIEGQQLPFEQVEKDITNYLSEASLRRGISQYIEVLLSECEIEGIDLNLSATPLVQ